MNSPWTDYVEVEPELNQRLLQLFRGEKDGFIKVGPRKYVYTHAYIKDGPAYFQFEPRPTDIWIITPARSGTTLMQEIVWLLANNFDYKTAAQSRLNVDRCPYLEFGSCTHPVVGKQLLANAGNNEVKYKIVQDFLTSGTTRLNEMTERRIIKSHLPFSLLNPKLLTCGAKVIYIARNPMDVAPSLYHLFRMFSCFDFVGTFEEFWDLFEGGNVLWGPIWPHLNEAWDLRDHPDVLFLFYENIVQDLFKNIHRIADFLNLPCSDNEAQQMVDHLNKEKFSKNQSVNYEYFRGTGILIDNEERFVRMKKEDEYKGDLTQRAKNWMTNNLKKTTMRFPET